MPTYKEIQEVSELPPIEVVQPKDLPENYPESAGAGAGTAEIASVEGLSIIGTSSDMRGFSLEGDAFPDPQSVIDASMITGTGAHGAAAAGATYAAKSKGGGPGGSNLKYINQGAVRSQSLKRHLAANMEDVSGQLGVTSEVFSGGQPRYGPNRVGSHRHNDGNAGDIYLRYNDGPKKGQLLDMRDGEDAAIMYSFIREMVARGYTGIGIGKGNDYMGPHGIHVGTGGDAIWGAGGKGANANPYFKKAWQQGMGDKRRGGNQRGDMASHIIAADEAAKVLGRHGTVAAATGFGGVQRNPAIAMAASQALNGGMGHKPVNWLAKNGPGMAGWQAFLGSGSSIANGYMSPIQHINAWSQAWFRPYIGIANQLWRGASGFNTLTVPEDLMAQIATGGQFNNILASALGGFGMGAGSAGSGGGGGSGDESDPGGGDPEQDYHPDRPSLQRNVPWFIDAAKNDAQGALIRASIIKSMPYAKGLTDGLKNKDGKSTSLEEYIKEANNTNYADLMSRMINSGMLNPKFALLRKG